MKKNLNISLITQKREELGLNQTELSEKVGVSKEAVSQWLNGESFPRPAKLLKLSQVLNLSYNDILQRTDEFEPVIAFRKVKSTKTTDEHVKRAKEMGFVLERLVEYLPFETITKPPILNNPQNDYNYIQQTVSILRDKLGISEIKVSAKDIIKSFEKFKTILIPVLLGSKKNHENALHIHLPKSFTNWVYINLDTKVFDFKFWLVHELGHVFTPTLSGDEAEDFADNFAAAFLFPKEISEKTYFDLKDETRIRDRINHIFNLAQRYVISPYTIQKEVDKFAIHTSQKKINLGESFPAQITNFQKKFQLVSEIWFDKTKPEVDEYLEVVEREFSTVFFDTLRKYISNEKSSPSFIRSILNIPIIDSKEIYQSLLNGIQKDTP